MLAASQFVGACHVIFHYAFVGGSRLYVSSVLHVVEFALQRARLVVRWVTVYGNTVLLFNHRYVSFLVQ